LSLPSDQADSGDPGDETIRKFRYQFGYGAILLIGAADGSLDYSGIWCEQFEDLLGEVSDQLFDAYQIKTRKPESGEWQINHEGFVKSIGRFGVLSKKFPGKIRRFKFVSNAKCSETVAKGSAHLSPVHLVAAVQKSQSPSDLGVDALKGLKTLSEKSGVAEGDLFNLLSCLDLVLGPTDRAFEDEIAHTHVPKLSGCAELSASDLGAVCRRLIARIADASSLTSNDPAKHWIPMQGGVCPHPLILAKRVSPDELVVLLNDLHGEATQFLPSLATLASKERSGSLDRMQKKMIRGGLASQYEVMRRRALTAEAVLLELATRPDGSQVVSQIENVVLSHCKDAELKAVAGSLFGAPMLIDVQQRLGAVAENDPKRVYGRDYDLLLGVAGLLTEDCQLWWSKPFALEEST
jgi:hypothetical protein